MLNKLYWIFYRILHPDFWMMNYRYDPSCDDFIDMVVDNDMFQSFGFSTMLIGGDTEVWICNYPYAYGVPYYRSKNSFLTHKYEGCPSVYHILKMRKYEREKRQQGYTSKIKDMKKGLKLIK